MKDRAQMFYTDCNHRLNPAEAKELTAICRKMGITKSLFYSTAIKRYLKQCREALDAGSVNEAKRDVGIPADLASDTVPANG